MSDSLFKDAPFEPEVIAVLNEAFDKACKALHDTGQPDIIKEILASRIIAAARKGGRDPAKLCEDALASFGIEADCG
jgi:hypothetical protein